ncbi:MAG: hypothetical protein KF799_07990 [Bdellovibrionales bacterium]|nr:hypothetical protein [Bdellovibrionales bacterium]
MLDFDHLADQRAKTLQQEPEGWRKAVWNSTFQKLTQSMSDGEVEVLISHCPSVGHLEWVAAFLEKNVRESGPAPFSVLTAEAAKSGVSLEEWIRTCFASGLKT